MVILLFTLSGSSTPKRGSMSAHTVFNPYCAIGIVDWRHDTGVAITSSPGSRPSVLNRTCQARPYELVSSTCFTPKYSANSLSNSLPQLPYAKAPECKILSSSGSSGIKGLYNGIIYYYLVILRRTLAGIPATTSPSNTSLLANDIAPTNPSSWT